MTLYRSIRDWKDIPPDPPLRAAETLSLDFKAEHSQDQAEHAKDLAAFANAFGGVVLVGVAEKSDSFSRKLVAVDVAKQIARDYENAARDLLAPRPLVDPCVIYYPHDDALALVAVNVDPYPGQLVGARLPGTDAWRFPIRTATRHCTYLDPEKLMIYSDARTRKAAILLSSIGEADRKPIFVRLLERREISNSSSSTESLLEGEFHSVDVNSNTVHMTVRFHDDGKTCDIPIWAPLEDIDAVWQGHGKWYVRLNGSIRVHKGATGGKSTMYLSGRGP